MSVRLSVCPSVRLSVCPSIRLSVRRSVDSSVPHHFWRWKVVGASCAVYPALLDTTTSFRRFVCPVKFSADEYYGIWAFNVIRFICLSRHVSLAPKLTEIRFLSNVVVVVVVVFVLFHCCFVVVIVVMLSCRKKLIMEVRERERVREREKRKTEGRRRRWWSE